MNFVSPTTLFVNSASNELGGMAERVGFEPTLPCGKHAFQACAFSHSAISPTASSLHQGSRAGADLLVHTQADRGTFYQSSVLESGKCVGWHSFKYQFGFVIRFK